MADEVAIDELYGLPLEDFTAARDALVARFREAGDSSTAARVKKLRKPSLAAWAVNQIAHQDPAAVERLLELREEIEGASEAQQMRAAADERRRLITGLVAQAEGILKAAGHAAGTNTLQAVTQSLHSGDDEEDREHLRRGTLTRELMPSGFGGPALSVEGVADEPEDPKLDEKRRRVEALTREAEDADREAARLERGVAEAERAVEKARSLAEGARRAADEAMRRAERARKELERATR